MHSSGLPRVERIRKLPADIPNLGLNPVQSMLPASVLGGLGPELINAEGITYLISHETYRQQLPKCL